MHTHLHAFTLYTHVHTHAHIHVYTMHICTHIYTNTPTQRTRQRHAGCVSNAVVKRAIADEKGGRKERTSPQLQRGGTALSLTSDQSRRRLGREMKLELPAGPGQSVLDAPLMDSLCGLLGS